MGDRPLAFHPEAEAEALAAVEWYARRNLAIATRFREELAAAMKWITVGPTLWPMIDSEHRRYVLKRFPYSVIFRERGPVLEIMAVAHARRRPGYWKSRSRLLQ